MFFLQIDHVNPISLWGLWGTTSTETKHARKFWGKNCCLSLSQNLMALDNPWEFTQKICRGEQG